MLRFFYSTKLAWIHIFMLIEHILSPPMILWRACERFNYSTSDTVSNIMSSFFSRPSVVQSLRWAVYRLSQCQQAWSLPCLDSLSRCTYFWQVLNLITGICDNDIEGNILLNFYDGLCHRDTPISCESWYSLCEHNTWFSRCTLHECLTSCRQDSLSR